MTLFIKNTKEWGTWVAQLVKHLTLDFGSGHDLRVVGSRPVSGSLLSGSLLEILFLPLPLRLHAHIYTQSISLPLK